jgi:hypothetical protein
MIKNGGGKIAIFAFDTANNVPKTGDAANLTAYVSKDGGAPVALTDTSATELDATNAKGVYIFDVTTGESNADLCVFTGKSSTANVQIDPVFHYPVVDPSGVTTLLARITGALPLASDYTAARAAKLDNLDAAISSRMATFSLPANFAAMVIDGNGRVDISKVLGAAINALIAGRLDANAQVVADKTAYALTSGERTAIANEVEAQIIDETDSEKVLTAITDKIASVNPSLAGLTLAAIASQVRTELTVELARIDAASSTRLATAGYTAPDNDDIATLIARLTATRAGLLDNLSRLDAAISSLPSSISDAVFDEPAADHNTAGTMGAKLNASGASGDPLAQLPSGYAAGTIGQLIGKLDVGAPTDTIIVIPGAPADASLCRVYGYLETLDNKPAANVEIAFVLASPSPTKSNRLISGRGIKIKTDSQGRVANAAGDPWLDLQRNDNLTPLGSKYLVSCKELFMVNVEITLNTDTFDLASIVP